LGKDNSSEPQQQQEQRCTHPAAKRKVFNSCCRKKEPAAVSARSARIMATAISFCLLVVLGIALAQTCPGVVRYRTAR
jgi:hypothetical protein